MDGFIIKKMRRLHLTLVVLALAMIVLLFWMVPGVSCAVAIGALVVCLRLRRLGRQFEGLAPFRPGGWVVWVCVGLVAIFTYFSLVQLVAVMFYLALLIPFLFENLIRLMSVLDPMGLDLLFWIGLYVVGGLGAALVAVSSYRAASRLSFMAEKDAGPEKPWEL